MNRQRQFIHRISTAKATLGDPLFGLSAFPFWAHFNFSNYPTFWEHHVEDVFLCKWNWLCIHLLRKDWAEIKNVLFKQSFHFSQDYLVFSFVWLSVISQGAIMEKELQKGSDSLHSWCWAYSRACMLWLLFMLHIPPPLLFWLFSTSCLPLSLLLLLHTKPEWLMQPMLLSATPPLPHPCIPTTECQISLTQNYRLNQRWVRFP